MSDLLPCPFCGGLAHIVAGEECAYVQCEDVKMHRALWLDADNASADEVAEQWNRREERNWAFFFPVKSGVIEDATELDVIYAWPDYGAASISGRWSANTHPEEAVAYVPKARADALSWRLRSYAVHDDNCKINKPPHFRDCSCGLKKVLDSMEKPLPVDAQEQALRTLARLGQEYDASSPGDAEADLAAAKEHLSVALKLTGFDGEAG